MTAESSESIFDFASKKPQPQRPLKKKRPPPEAAAPAPTSTPMPVAPAAAPIPAAPNSNISMQEVDTLVESITKKREQLTQQLNDVYKRSGQTRDSVAEYLNDPSNFTETTWQIVQDEREALKKKVTKLVSRSDTQQGREKKKVTEEKKRKGKTLGARRNWLSM